MPTHFQSWTKYKSRNIHSISDLVGGGGVVKGHFLLANCSINVEATKLWPKKCAGCCLVVVVENLAQQHQQKPREMKSPNFFMIVQREASKRMMHFFPPQLLRIPVRQHFIHGQRQGTYLASLGNCLEITLKLLWSARDTGFSCISGLEMDFLLFFRTSCPWCPYDCSWFFQELQ